MKRITTLVGVAYLLFCTVLSIAALVIILCDIFSKGAPSLTTEFIFGYPRQGMTEGGIFPAIVGTTLVTLITAVFSIPLGLFAAIYHPGTDVNDIRRRIGMVFQKPNPFPKSIADNVAIGLRINGTRNRRQVALRVEDSLRAAFLWEEVKGLLDRPALSLSGGQQQRLCIARCIAVAPEVILMDEPTSALDPHATQQIENLVLELKKNYTVVIVTHNMQQARRVADRVAMLYLGELIEYRDAGAFFGNPRHDLAQQYVSGQFG